MTQKQWRRVQVESDSCVTKMQKTEAKLYKINEDRMESKYKQKYIRASAVKHGCACKHCSAAECPRCMPGHTRAAEAKVTPESLQCECRCLCQRTKGFTKPEGSPEEAPKGYVRIDISPEGGHPLPGCISLHRYKCDTPPKRCGFHCGCAARI